MICRTFLGQAFVGDLCQTGQRGETRQR